MVATTILVYIYIGSSGTSTPTKLVCLCSGRAERAPTGTTKTAKYSFWGAPTTMRMYNIDVNLAGNDFMVFSLSHELTHRIKEALPEQFDDFAKMLFEAVGEKMSVTERIKLWEKNNKKYYPNLNPEELTDLAYEEVVCEMCESFLTDEVVARKLSEKIQKEKKTLWEKIKDFFTDLINRLKKAYEGLDPQSENGRLVREMTTDLTKVKEAWAELVVESGKVKKIATESEAKSSKKDYEDYNKPITLADVEILRSIGRKSINKFTADEIKKSQKWAYKFYQELGTKSPFFPRLVWRVESARSEQNKNSVCSYHQYFGGVTCQRRLYY